MRRVCLNIAILLGIMISAAPETQARVVPQVSVSLLSLFHPKKVIVTFDRNMVMHVSNNTIEGKVFNVFSTPTGIQVNNLEGQTFGLGEITIYPNKFHFALEIPGKITRRYVGNSLSITKQENGELLIVESILFGEYIAILAASEMGNAPDEALQAFKIVASSWMLSGKRHEKNFHFCDTTHCAVFKGLDNEKLVNRIEHLPPLLEKMLYKNEIVPGYFHAACGGTTHTPMEVWGNKTAYPYANVRCNYCRNAKNFRWSSEIKRKDIARGLNMSEGLMFTVSDRGHELELQVSDNKEENRLMLKEDFRIKIGRELGWNLLPSPWFTMVRLGETYHFRGSGFGHGVGLCIAGAIEQAKQGRDWKSIVSFYFPNTEISR